METLENFDAVQYMREQRAKLSQKLWAMKPKEVVEYFEKKAKVFAKTTDNHNS
jgi:hypothetical protein